MRKSIVAAAVLAMAGLVWAAGRPGIVHTRDGGTYDGTVDERDDNVVVNVHGIETTIARDNIASISYGEFDQRWADDYAKLKPDDAAGHLAAARRAFEQKRYDLAEQALRDTLAADPNNAEADQLLKLTLNQRRMESAPPAAADPAAPPSVVNNGTQATVKPFGVWNTLKADDINRVKQVEIRENDTKIRFAFADNVRKKFYDASPKLAATYSSYGDFIKQPPLTQALAIIDNGTVEQAKDVRVTNDPEVIGTFRRDVLPLVLQGCATSGCHGGNGNAATLKFAMATPATDAATVYTDFYVLQSVKVKVRATGKPAEVVGNTVMPDTAYMMDRTRPEESLLLQYGLSDQAAEVKHPYVRGYNGIFPRARDDQKYKTVLAFLQTLRPVQPEYGIDFTLARQDAPNAAPAATQP